MELKTVELNIFELKELKEGVNRDKLVIGVFTERTEAKGFKKETDIIKEVSGIHFVIGELRG